MRPIYSATLFILILGGLNWGALALAETDAIALLFGETTVITRFLYALVGLCALVQILPWLQQIAKDDGHDPTRQRRPEV